MKWFNRHKVKITADDIELFTRLLTPDYGLTNRELTRLQQEQHYLALVKIANEFWLTGELVYQLKTKALWRNLPPLLIDYLTEIDQLYLARNQQLLHEINHCCQLLAQQQIKVVLLKGAASLLNGTYANASSRYMADIDLLISNEHLLEAQQLLKTHGYQNFAQQYDIQPNQHHHLPALIRPDSLVSIELHSAPIKAAFRNLLTSEQAWQQQVALSHPQIKNLHQLSATHQFILALAHSELVDQNHSKNTLNFRQLHIIYKIASYYRQQINWREVKQHFEQAGQQTVLVTMGYRLRHFFAFGLPEIESDNQMAAAGLDRAIKRYLDNQGDSGRSDQLTSLIAGYRPSVIKSLYGVEGRYAVVSGYYLHIRRHLTMLVSYLITKRKR